LETKDVCDAAASKWNPRFYTTTAQIKIIKWKFTWISTSVTPPGKPDYSSYTTYHGYADVKKYIDHYHDENLPIQQNWLNNVQMASSKPWKIQYKPNNINGFKFQLRYKCYGEP
jgi:hypothetical protein